MYIRKIRYATNTTETKPSSRCNIPNFLGTLHVQVVVVVDDLGLFRPQPLRRTTPDAKYLSMNVYCESCLIFRDKTILGTQERAG